MIVSIWYHGWKGTYQMYFEVVWDGHGRWPWREKNENSEGTGLAGCWFYHAKLLLEQKAGFWVFLHPVHKCGILHPWRAQKWESLVIVRKVWSRFLWSVFLPLFSGGAQKNSNFMQRSDWMSHSLKSRSNDTKELYNFSFVTQSTWSPRSCTVLSCRSNEKLNKFVSIVFLWYFFAFT